MTHTEGQHNGEGTAYLFGPFRFIPARRALLCGDSPQRVGGRAIDILAVLLERPGEPVGKRELIARVWPTSVVEDGNLKVHVAALRRTLGECEPGSHYIATINGRGYCFVAPVRVDRAAAPATVAQVTEQIGSLLNAVEVLENERDRDRKELQSLRAQLEVVLRQPAAARRTINPFLPRLTSG